MKLKKVFGATVALVVAASSLSGCTAQKPDLTPSADGVTPAVVVQAIDNRYEPREVTVRVGEAVRWDFLGGAKHDVVEPNGLFVSDLVRSGSFTHVFTEPGEYAYDCSIHPEMRGLVKVVQ
ncbi:amicyanin [Leucobacter sp. OH2974_COT-288]|nr:amicyanin [Leucobacter sp. OH2974_COT-288]